MQYMMYTRHVDLHRAYFLSIHCSFCTMIYLKVLQRTDLGLDPANELVYERPYVA